MFGSSESANIGLARSAEAQQAVERSGLSLVTLASPDGSAFLQVPAHFIKNQEVKINRAGPRPEYGPAACDDSGNVGRPASVRRSSFVYMSCYPVGLSFLCRLSLVHVCQIVRLGNSSIDMY